MVKWNRWPQWKLKYRSAKKSWSKTERTIMQRLQSWINSDESQTRLTPPVLLPCLPLSSASFLLLIRWQTRLHTTASPGLRLMAWMKRLSHLCQCWRSQWSVPSHGKQQPNKTNPTRPNYLAILAATASASASVCLSLCLSLSLAFCFSVLLPSVGLFIKVRGSMAHAVRVCVRLHKLCGNAALTISTHPTERMYRLHGNVKSFLHRSKTRWNGDVDNIDEIPAFTFS